MNYLDIVLVLPLIFGAWRGFKKGLIIELFTLLALVVGIYAGIHFSDFMSSILREHAGIQSEYLPVISFSLIFLGVGAIVYFAGKLIEKAVNAVALTPMNKLAGLFFGLVKMLYLTSTLLVIIESYDQRNEMVPENLKDDSLLYHPVKSVSLTTIPALKHSELFIKTAQQLNE
ncbi:MAG: CvpA family protein [Crocinitomicaceae bacterium]|nr:CvpA family protein [Crocinitomicaceae bacterium]MBK8926053.1 CvpA family protein [Crocinitomicaceae bacterium]